MPEITDAEYRQFVRYQALGTPEELESQRKKVKELEDDNKAQRDTIRDLKAAQPAEGSVVVPKEMADALAAYEAIGTPDELRAALGERDTLRQKDAARTRQDQVRAAVEAAGWPAEAALTLEDMKSLEGAAFEVRTETNEKGEEVRTAYLTLPGEGQQPQRLTDFAKDAPQLRGLRTDGDRGAGGGAAAPPPVFPRQSSAGAPAKPETKGGVDDLIQQTLDRARAPNPLRPARA